MKKRAKRTRENEREVVVNKRINYNTRVTRRTDNINNSNNKAQQSVCCCYSAVTIGKLLANNAPKRPRFNELPRQPTNNRQPLREERVAIC